MKFALTAVLLLTSMVASSMSMATGEVRPECQRHSECPSNKPVCNNSKCSNPCDKENICEGDAICELPVNLRQLLDNFPDTLGMIGKTLCWSPTEFHCVPNPCGVNAECRPGFDTEGNKESRCRCLSGYHGNPYVLCEKN